LTITLVGHRCINLFVKLYYPFCCDWYDVIRFILRCIVVELFIARLHIQVIYFV